MIQRFFFLKTRRITKGFAGLNEHALAIDVKAHTMPHTGMTLSLQWSTPTLMIWTLVETRAGCQDCSSCWNQLLYISSLSFPFGHGHYRKLQNWRASEHSWNFEGVIKAFTNDSGQSSNCQKIKPALVCSHQPFNEVLENFSEALLEISIMLEVDALQRSTVMLLLLY